MAHVLVLFAHPLLEKSRVQRVLYDSALSVPGVTGHDLYEHYPDFDIDVQAEQALLLAHDVVVLQHPFYWYSSPPLVKQWIDLVLEHGWAYGRQGKALAGKSMLNAISTGGSREAYQAMGPQRRTIRDFLAPFEQTAVLCNMRYLPPFVVHGTHRARGEQIAAHAAEYASLLTMLVDGTLDAGVLHTAAYLNDLLPAVSNPTVTP
jgi:glutathione-regulated potassium-efflux system ancillary protein KefG